MFVKHGQLRSAHKSLFLSPYIVAKHWWTVAGPLFAKQRQAPQWGRHEKCQFQEICILARAVSVTCTFYGKLYSLNIPNVIGIVHFHKLWDTVKNMWKFYIHIYVALCQFIITTRHPGLGKFNRKKSNAIIKLIFQVPSSTDSSEIYKTLNVI